MKIIIDTNIIFSTLLNTKGAIGDLVFNSNECFTFYSCSYMRFEIQKHWNKLLKISKLTDEELHVAYDRVMLKIRFINEELIPASVWEASENLVADIDIDDIDFVALQSFLGGKLWTGDKPLYNGLKSKGFEDVLTTPELVELRKKQFGTL